MHDTAAVMANGFTPILSASPPANKDTIIAENHTTLIRIPIYLQVHLLPSVNKMGG